MRAPLQPSPRPQTSRYTRQLPARQTACAHQIIHVHVGRSDGHRPRRALSLQRGAPAEVQLPHVLGVDAASR